MKISRRSESVMLLYMLYMIIPYHTWVQVIDIFYFQKLLELTIFVKSKIFRLICTESKFQAFPFVFLREDNRHIAILEGTAAVDTSETLSDVLYLLK